MVASFVYQPKCHCLPHFRGHGWNSLPCYTLTREERQVRRDGHLLPPDRTSTPRFRSKVFTGMFCTPCDNVISIHLRFCFYKNVSLLTVTTPRITKRASRALRDFQEFCCQVAMDASRLLSGMGLSLVDLSVLGPVGDVWGETILCGGLRRWTETNYIYI